MNDSFSSLYLTDIGYLSGSMFPLWVGNFPAGHRELVARLQRPLAELDMIIHNELTQFLSTLMKVI